MQKREIIKTKILAELLKAAGKSKAISMNELHRRVMGEEARHDIHDTRLIRQLITDLRRSGVPIASTSIKGRGGYYVPVGSELDEYCKRLRNRALKILSLEAKIKDRTLTEIIHEISLSLGG